MLCSHLTMMDKQSWHSKLATLKTGKSTGYDSCRKCKKYTQYSLTTNFTLSFCGCYSFFSVLLSMKQKSKQTCPHSNGFSLHIYYQYLCVNWCINFLESCRGQYQHIAELVARPQ